MTDIGAGAIPSRGEAQNTAPRAAGLKRTLRAAIVHHQAGRLDRAEALYRKILASDLDHPDALHLLGVVAYQRGQIASALALIERALPALAALPEAHLNYGNALGDVGRIDEAAACYRRAIDLDPDYGMAHNNLARLLAERSQYEPALDSARRAVALLPDFAGAQINLATALLGLERHAEAEAPLRRALATSPDRGETHRDLGWALTRLLRFDEALACHRRAIALKPGDPAGHYALSMTLQLAGDPAASEASLRQTLSLAPDFAKAWHALGSVLRTMGRFDEALDCFRRALELDPDLPEAHRSLATTGEQAGDEEQLRRLQTVLASPERSGLDRVAAGFALGGLLDNADRYDDAFPTFAQANALYRQYRAEAGERFDADALRRETDGLIGLGSPEFFSRVGAWGNSSELPVFIVGMPRSGTTLIEQIAASHSQVFGAGERREIGAIATALTAHDNDRPVEAWDPLFARAQADRHVAGLQALGGASVRVIDKMPDNVFTLWLIAALFPSARVILSQRDLRDTALSCYFHRFTDGHPFAYDLADCGHRALEVERLATHWLRVLPLEMLVVDYEELVADPEGESRRLIEFLGLDWEPACLDFHKTQRPVFTASSWQVRQPMFTRSIGRWRHYERHLGPLLEVLAQTGPGQ
jgi:tetratricopeptide (TPR) repeat protein